MELRIVHGARTATAKTGHDGHYTLAIPADFTGTSTFSMHFQGHVIVEPREITLDDLPERHEVRIPETFFRQVELRADGHLVKDGILTIQSLHDEPRDTRRTLLRVVTNERGIARVPDILEPPLEITLMSESLDKMETQTRKSLPDLLSFEPR